MIKINFTDKNRDELEVVYIISPRNDYEQREESNSLLWDFEKKISNILNLYKVPARAVKIGESIYSQEGENLSYRAS